MSEDASKRLRHALVARVERCVIADEPEDLRRLLANVLHVEVELPRPARALTACFPEGVARLIDRFQRLLERRIHLATFDKPSAHLVDDRDVFDPYGADLDASHALHAGPERLRSDDVADDVLFRAVQRFEVQLVPDPERTLGDQTSNEGFVSAIRNDSSRNPVRARKKRMPRNVQSPITYRRRPSSPSARSGRQ